jgi:hypothetical protein
VITFARLEEGKELEEIANTGARNVKGRTGENIRREKKSLLVRKVISFFKNQ